MPFSRADLHLVTIEVGAEPLSKGRRQSPYNAPRRRPLLSWSAVPPPVVPLGIDRYWQVEKFVKVGSDTGVLVEKRPRARVSTSTVELSSVRSNAAVTPPGNSAARLEGRLQSLWCMYVGPVFTCVGSPDVTSSTV